MKLPALKLPALLAGAMLAAAPAFAQSTSAIGTDRWTEVEADMVVPGFGMQADLLSNLDVYSLDGQNLGDVEDVIGFNENEVLAVAVDFAGTGGYPDRDDVVVPLDLLTLEPGGRWLVLAATPDEVLMMEHYED